MPDPAWSMQYNFAQTPEGNGFTRILYEPNPTINLVTGGTPANRRIEVDSSAGGTVCFVTSNVPAFNPGTGVTAEATLNVSGTGSIGYEVRFLTFIIGLCIYTDKFTLERLGTVPLSVNTASNNADILWRVTFDGSLIRIYRAGVLVATDSPVFVNFPFQEFQFWVELGAIGTIRTMKYYSGGAVAP